MDTSSERLGVGLAGAGLEVVDLLPVELELQALA
jgi:hypothetical protein